jgi:hypothetical protein
MRQQKNSHQVLHLAAEHNQLRHNSFLSASKDICKSIYNRGIKGKTSNIKQIKNDDETKFRPSHQLSLTKDFLQIESQKMFVYYLYKY